MAPSMGIKVHQIVNDKNRYYVNMGKIKGGSGGYSHSYRHERTRRKEFRHGLLGVCSNRIQISRFSTVSARW